MVDLEIFKTTFGEEMIVSGGGGTSVKGAVAEQDIKKKRTTEGLVADGNRPGHAGVTAHRAPESPGFVLCAEHHAVLLMRPGLR